MHGIIHNKINRQFQQFVKFNFMPTVKKHQMSHLIPLCFSNQILCVCKYVGVCVCFLRSHWYFKQDKGNQFLLGLLHHWQGRDLISNKMFSLCSRASHVCVASCSEGFPTVHSALHNNSFRPHIKLCVGDALLCRSSASLNTDYYEENLKPDDVILKGPFY